jgi:hypothetical protein
LNNLIQKKAGRKRYPIYNKCRICGSIITISPATNKQSARHRRFFNPPCRQCSSISDWTRIKANEDSKQLFSDPRDARRFVTQLQNQDIPAIMDHLGEGEYLVTIYKLVDSKEDVCCPEEFEEGCIVGGERCQFYQDGVCSRVEDSEEESS